MALAMKPRSCSLSGLGSVAFSAAAARSAMAAELFCASASGAELLWLRAMGGSAPSATASSAYGQRGLEKKLFIGLFVRRVNTAAVCPANDVPVVSLPPATARARILAAL